MKGKVEGFVCPVCGQFAFPNNSSDEFCPVCMWQNDYVQNTYPDFAGGPNRLSLNEFRQLWQECGCDRKIFEPKFRERYKSLRR